MLHSVNAQWTCLFITVNTWEKVNNLLEFYCHYLTSAEFKIKSKYFHRSLAICKIICPFKIFYEHSDRCIQKRADYFHNNYITSDCYINHLILTLFTAHHSALLIVATIVFEMSVTLFSVTMETDWMMNLIYSKAKPRSHDGLTSKQWYYWHTYVGLFVTST